MPLLRLTTGAMALLLLLPLRTSRAEEAPEGDPQKPQPTATLPGARRYLEKIARDRGWTLAFEEDDVLVVAGTCDAKQAKERFGLCKEAMARLCEVLQIPPEQLRGTQQKFIMLFLARKPEYMAWAAAEATRREEPKYVELLEKVPGAGWVICLDPSYGTTPESIRHLSSHLFAHQMSSHYAQLHGTEDVPGWLDEGLAAYVDGCLNTSPASSCVAQVGYDNDRYNQRNVGGKWEHAVYKAVKELNGLKGKDREKSPFTRLANLTAVKFDKLSSNDVAVSWHVVRDLIHTKKKPEAFKAFFDQALDGGKQLPAFQAAFGKSIDDYEKTWMKEVLSSEEPKDKPKK